MSLAEKLAKFSKGNAVKATATTETPAPAPAPKPTPAPAPAPKAKAKAPVTPLNDPEVIEAVEAAEIFDSKTLPATIEDIKNLPASVETFLSQPLMFIVPDYIVDATPQSNRIPVKFIKVLNTNDTKDANKIGKLGIRFKNEEPELIPDGTLFYPLAVFGFKNWGFNEAERAKNMEAGIWKPSYNVYLMSNISDDLYILSCNGAYAVGGMQTLTQESWNTPHVKVSFNKEWNRNVEYVEFTKSSIALPEPEDINDMKILALKWAERDTLRRKADGSLE